MRKTRRWCMTGGRALLSIVVLAISTLAFLIDPLSLRAAAPYAPPPSRTTPDAQVPPPSFPVTRTADGREAAANRIIVAFKPGVSGAEQDAIHRTVAARAAITPAPVSRVNGATQYVNITGALSPDTVIQSYRADPRVRYAEPDYLVRALDTPNDASFGDQYGLRAIQAAAWNLTHGAPSVKIAILDCGIHEAHPDLIGKVVARQDFTGSVYGTDDRCNHGTHVAGIASANTNNTIGVAGVGYTTSLLNGKVLDDGASGTISGVADGIRWATDNGAKVISMSLGGDGACPTSVQDAIDAAWSRNVVVVAAAGNSGSDQAFFPAGCAHVIAVASTDASDARLLLLQLWDVGAGRCARHVDPLDGQPGGERRGGVRDEERHIDGDAARGGAGGVGLGDAVGHGGAGGDGSPRGDSGPDRGDGHELALRADQRRRRSCAPRSATCGDRAECEHCAGGECGIHADCHR